MTELLVLVALVLLGLSIPIVLYAEIEGQRNKRLKEYRLKLLMKVLESRFEEEMPITSLLVTLEKGSAYVVPSNVPLISCTGVSYVKQVYNGLDHSIPSTIYSNGVMK